jgi:hypothetical protein
MEGLMANKDKSKKPEENTEVDETAEAVEASEAKSETTDSETAAAESTDDKSEDAPEAKQEDAVKADEAKPKAEAKAPSSSEHTWRDDIDYVVAAPVTGDAKGMLALFDHPDDILWAAEKARDKGFERWDVITPFPVHGMDDAMGIGRSWIPFATFAFAMCGLATATSIEFGTMFFDWPIIIGGKPFFAWPSFVPIMFELTVLFAGIGTAVTMFRAGGMPNPSPVILDTRLSRDRFGVWISADDAKFDLTKTRAFLEGLSPVEIREIRSDA